MQGSSSTIFSPTARLPRKLVNKIQSLDFVEMSDLLPEAWIPDANESPSSIHGRKFRKRTPVADILVSTECYALMAAVLAEKFPTFSPRLFAYIRRVVHAEKNFRGTAWVAYDRLYRCQAAARRSLAWALEDSALYNEAFVGQVKFIAGCRYWLSENHATEACQEFNPPYPSYIQASPFLQHSIPKVNRYSSAAVTEVCIKFNENHCNYPACKYRHVCFNCGYPYPAVFCGSRVVISHHQVIAAVLLTVHVNQLLSKLTKSRSHCNRQTEMYHIINFAYDQHV